jgi:hypothetical protein
VRVQQVWGGYTPLCVWLVVLVPEQVIANTGGILGVGPTPHEMLMRPGMTTVDVDGQPFTGPKTPRAKWHKVRQTCSGGGGDQVP